MSKKKIPLQFGKIFKFTVIKVGHIYKGKSKTWLQGLCSTKLYDYALWSYVWAKVSQA